MKTPRSARGTAKAPRSADSLRAAAERAMRHAYAPYSEFRVGAALLGADGSVFAGCNVENASHPVGTCAERSALATAVAAGCREFTHLTICTEAPAPTPPCGMCRQALSEFSPSLDITSCTTGGASAKWNLGELLPSPFTRQSVRRR